MARQLHSTWYRNGEDIFFQDEAFHKIAYQITYTYQRFMARMEQEHGQQKAYYEAKRHGWGYDIEINPASYMHIFKLPGYELRVMWEYQYGKNKGRATAFLPAIS